MNPLRFTVALAGVPVEIRCQYPQNRRFFREYLSDSPAALTIAPTRAECAEIQARYTQIHGDAAKACPDWFWENQALHRKLCEGLLAYDVLLLHASALTLDGQAFLFTADSGTGKSTHTQFWRERFGERVTVINDDKPLLKVTDGGVFVCGTPWNGKRRLSRNASAPVRAIVELERDSFNHVERCLDPFKALYLHALRCAEPSLSLKVLTLEKAIVERTPFYRLGCNLNPDAAEIAFRGIERLEAEAASRGVRRPETESASRGGECPEIENVTHSGA